MALARWTDEKIKALKLPPGKAEQRVLVEPGLYLHVRACARGAASKVWQYRVQVAGVRRWLSLGSYPEVGLAKAKAELLVHDTAREAAKKGEADHPVIAARFARKTKREQATVQVVFDAWVADKRLGSSRKAGAPVRERTIKVLTENFDADVQPRLADAKIAMLTREALQACIDAPRKRGAPGAAAHVYRTLRGLLNFAIKRGDVKSDPMIGIENPKPYRPSPVVAANDAELQVLFKALDSSRLWLATKFAIEFQLLTGARPSEVREAAWDEINFEKATWTIPAERVKSGREFRIHLSPQAVAALKRAESIRGRSDHVFGGAGGEGPLEKMAVARALSRLAERTSADGGKRLRPHDLRRTFRTMLSRIGVAPHVAELLLNHQEAETMRRVYDGYDYRGEMIDAWDKAGAHIATLRDGGAQVIPMIAKKRSA